MIDFNVWFDPEIHEVLAIEVAHMTEPLSQQLAKEGVQVHEIAALNRYEAVSLFIEQYENINKSAVSSNRLH